jgi:ATP/maltotriose-dependent transcriptional regulator MalT
MEHLGGENIMSYAWKRSVDDRLDLIVSLLKEMKMALSQDFLDLSKKIDDATNAVAARITLLQGQITNSMSDVEVANVKAALQAEVDKLTAMGADPVNPVPVTPTP